jgi:hypothetical protein
MMKARIHNMALMKVYEVGTPSHYDSATDECDCTIWIATDCPVIMQSTREGFYVKEINIPLNSEGIDLIIKSKDIK